jgi:hypothetical protein
MISVGLTVANSGKLGREFDIESMAEATSVHCMVIVWLTEAMSSNAVDASWFEVDAGMMQEVDASDGRRSRALTLYWGRPVSACAWTLN